VRERGRPKEINIFNLGMGNGKKGVLVRVRTNGFKSYSTEDIWENNDDGNDPGGEGNGMYAKKR